MSCADLCCLFCWPPLPSRIAAKLAFLPPEPTYSLVTSADATTSAADRHGVASPAFQLHLSDRAEFQFSNEDKSRFLDAFLATTANGSTIACMMVSAGAHARSKYTLLFSHGNAVDLGQISSFLIGLARRINMNVFSYDYSGYGASTGRPLEKNLYADIDCAWQQLIGRYNLSPGEIVLYGQSIGTVPTVDLATRVNPAGVVLHSPLLSGLRVAFPDTSRTWFFDAFPNIEKAPRIRSPCLIIHGTEDEVIDFAHGLALHDRLPQPAVEPLWIEGAGHNDIELRQRHHGAAPSAAAGQYVPHEDEGAGARGGGGASMTCRDLCRLFCWPPLPSRIAAKLAFLPPRPTYSLVGDMHSPRFQINPPDMEDPAAAPPAMQLTEDEADCLEAFTANTARGSTIACVLIRTVRSRKGSKYTLLFSHGNAVDLGQMSGFLIDLGRKLNMNVFSYDYSGYGASTGQPLEKNLYADIDCAWQQLIGRYNLSPGEIVLYGQSIGTVPTVDLATRVNPAGVVLHSPLLSGLRVAFPDTSRTWFFDAFPNIEKAPRIHSPCLVIHGTEDEVINIAHGLAIYERLPRSVDPLWVEGAGHNDIELFPQYLLRLRSFLYDELEAMNASIGADADRAVAGGGSTSTTARDKVRGDQS
uniref:Hydrolase_4 domain-containing protein n=1 Tax=Macrostomum lignano TaxID=282301 RepID=A0A1I8G1G9_9PLAT